VAAYLQFPEGSGPSLVTSGAADLLAVRQMLDAAVSPDQLDILAQAEALALASWSRVEARVLAAQVFDRRRWLQGQPQKFGTVAVRSSQGWRLWPVAEGTTDSERAKWGLPPLRELERLLGLVGR